MTRDDVFKAIDVADEAGLRALLTADPSLAESRSADGVSAVLFTLYLAKFNLTKALLEQNPTLDIYDLAALNMPDEMGPLLDENPDLLNQCGGDGFAPLHLACFFGSLNSASFLIGRGADVNLMANNQSRIRPLHSATAAGHGAIVALLLKLGADANALQAGGFTPLMAAANLGNDPVVNMLLENGADTTIKAEDGRQAADFAKEAGFDGLLDRL